MPFNVALSGIRAANTDLEVTGNNIANASTTGFKTSRVEFGDVYAGSLLGSSSNAPGSGVNLLKIRQQFGQGNLNFTENQLDLAVSDAGFFVVSDQGEQLYTRSGAFGLDSEGFIVTNTGMNLQGYSADDNGNVSGTLSDLQVDVSTQAPRQTTGVEATLNLNANQSVLESVGSSFTTDGSAIGVAQVGISDATTTTMNLGAVAVPIDFAANPTTFDVTLAGSTPASGNGTLSLVIDSSTANSVQDVANLINSAIFSSPTPINVQAFANGGNLELRDINEGVSSTVTLGAVTGANALSTAMTGAPASVAGIANVDNGYQSQTLEIEGPSGGSVTFNSEDGASAAQTASELNSLAGVTASATTEATVQSGTLDNTNSNLTLNGVLLTSNTPANIAAEINALSTSTLPGVTAEVNTAGDLVITSSVGTDLSFAFDSDVNATPGVLDVIGRSGTGVQSLTGINDGLVIGGEVSIVMEEGYVIADSVPAVGNLFAPLTAASFTEVPINSFDPNDQATYNHATSATVHDSLGNPHTMTQYFVKQPYDPADASTSPNHWVMYVQVDGQEVGDPDPTLPSPENTLPTRASYNVHFNEDGSLNESLTDTMLVSNWTPVDDEGNETGSLGPLNVLQGGVVPVVEPPSSSNFLIDLAGSTQFGAEFGVEQLDQNGYTTGRLAGLDVSDSGIIFARFTNGEAQVLGQVALANFNNVEALKPAGNTMWAQTSDTGEAVIGAPGTASLGTINSGALEESNVDLSEQLVNLIIAQRNFQASAKTIETANQTTQTIINLR
ncbi:flagellar hook-basal body complex protein [Gilvimarinus agarilyticus]|uniref:flagellar hook-basal body complex protein n=1 Tax=unclassified Gilvimarinus TaxID=2642066 RepID=UPI001C08A8BD|nr:MULTISPECIES: flagellar hook-basal body complex protein [unclassified Gilvimarinus]MBU2887257.1 flagellar hook-basal body complex protein [Gilvimarinus agarilyticus]MDO6571916.1 flagellar hook-basal body complex protein [Gilvimarinus sp. 2_MG-2023]MDO6745985.1 flagellar hook-basal body complex protein [Gilvimarinus sp. 1_MG-2023]